LIKKLNACEKKLKQAESLAAYDAEYSQASRKSTIFVNKHLEVCLWAWQQIFEIKLECYDLSSSQSFRGRDNLRAMIIIFWQLQQPTIAKMPAGFPKSNFKPWRRACTKRKMNKLIKSSNPSILLTQYIKSFKTLLSSKAVFLTELISTSIIQYKM
jgi:hypothetical protein